MEILRWIGFGAFFVSSLVIGIRLLKLARRTAQLPELLIGISVLCIGPIGYGLSMLAFAFRGSSTILSATLQGSSFVAVFVGAASQYLFVWYVYRRTSSWGRPVAFAAIALMAMSYAGDLMMNGLVDRTQDGIAYSVGQLVRLLGFAWNSLESLRMGWTLRQRAKLGLADLTLSHRFLFWGVGAGAAFGGSLIGAVIRVATGGSALEIPVASLIISSCGLTAACCMWMAFHPPSALTGRRKGDAVSSAAD
jgi:hypothetical protein